MSQWVQRVALGAAILAVAVVGVALILSLRRSGARGPELIARPMHAGDLSKLSADTVERADGGVHVQPTVAAALGLSPGDTLIALSGRPLGRPSDIDAVLADLAALHPSQWFVELSRGGAHRFERWDLDGAVQPAPRSDGAGPDPQRGAIHRVGATRFELPRALVDAWIADPSRLLAGVASLRRSATGLELQTIRPGSLVSALGFEDGDVIRAVNGTELVATELEAVAPLLAHASQITLDVRRRGAPLLFNYWIR